MSSAIPAPAGASASGVRRYRPDLDGLRGFATVCVLLFHYGLGLRGGFVGLDVFFVLTGYLIGGRLFADVGAGRFSFVRFYERRVRRLAPAALVMIIAAFVAAQFILLPHYYRFFASSALANLYFGSNYLFKSEDGYFDPASMEKPLLHTWSLSVEEQFYFVLPILIVLVARWPGRWAWPWIIGAAGIASFIVNLRMTITEPEHAYFLAPARAWAIVIGALTALVPPLQLSARVRNLLSVIGLAMIAVPACALDAASRYPGWAGLLPGLAGALIIIAGDSQPEPHVNRWIGAQPLRAVGQWSYSLYLWHWPVLVFTQYLLVQPLDMVQRCGLLALSCLIGAASWKYIEQPFRSGRGLPTRTVMKVCGSAALVVLVFSLAVRLTRGAPRRAWVDPEIARTAEQDFAMTPCYIASKNHKRRLDLDRCTFGADGVEPTVLLWGDSHSRQWQTGLVELARSRDVAFVQASISGCVPVVGFVLARRPGCAPANDSVYAWLSEHPHIRTVVLAAYWGSYADLPTLPARMAAMTQALAARGIRVVAVASVPTYTTPVPIMLSAWQRWHEDADRVDIASTDRASHRDEDRRAFASVFAQASADIVLDPASQICADERCAIRVDHHTLYFDSTHLSEAGARRYASVFEPVFASPAGKEPSR
jgi:peptidoglycan/LPS O-acetylase OafA/YrhL